MFAHNVIHLILDQRNSCQTQGITLFVQTRSIDSLDAFDRCMKRVQMRSQMRSNEKPNAFQRQAKRVRTRNRTRSLNVRNVFERNPKRFRTASETRSNEILDSFALYMYITVYVHHCTSIVMLILALYYA